MGPQDEVQSLRAQMAPLLKQVEQERSTARELQDRERELTQQVTLVVTLGSGPVV